MLARITSKEDLDKAIKCKHTTIVRIDYYERIGFIKMRYDRAKNEFHEIDMYGENYPYSQVLNEPKFRIHFSHPLDEIWNLISGVSALRERMRKGENPCYKYLNDIDETFFSIVEIEDKVNAFKNTVRELYGPICNDEYELKELHQILDQVEL